MAKIILTGRFMSEKLKKHWTSKDFANHFGVTEEEFISALEKKFSSKASGQMKKRMEKNAKRKTSTQIVETEETHQATAEGFTSSIIDFDEEDSAESQLSILKRKEQNLSNSLRSLESQHSKLISRRAGQRAEFKRQKQRLSSLIEKLEKAKKEFEVTFSDWQRTGEEMKSLSKSIKQQKLDLRSLRKEIAVIQKVFIFAYISGDIEIENNSEVDLSIDTDAVDVKFREVFELPVVDSLTKNQIRQLAGLLLISEKIQANKGMFEIIFDSSTLEDAYNEIIGC